MRAIDFDPDFYKIFEVTKKNQIAIAMSEINIDIDNDYFISKKSLEIYINRTKSLTNADVSIIKDFAISNFKNFKIKYENLIDNCNTYLDSKYDTDLQNKIKNVHDKFSEIVQMMTTAGIDIDNI